MTRRRDRRRTRGGPYKAAGGDPLDNFLRPLPGLQGWFDPQSDGFFTFSTGAQISAWVPRLGTLGGLTLAQATSASQPTRSLATASLGGKNTVQLDGVDDFLAAPTAAPWTFLHDNTGATVIHVERIDSTGFAIQYPYATAANATTNVGIFTAAGTSNLTVRVANGGAAFQNNLTTAVAAHYTRDVSRWRVWTYGVGVVNLYASGSTVTLADTAGQTPSVAAPQLPFTVGRSVGASLSYKGHFGDIIIFNRVISTAERNAITGLLADKYAIAP